MPKSQRVRRDRSGLAMLLAALALSGCTVAAPPLAQAQTPQMPEQSGAPTYVDLVELGHAAEVVAVVLIEQQITVPPERAPNVAPGKVRLYLEALTRNLLAAPGAMGESVVFLVDVAIDSQGDVPELEERAFLVFADQAPGRPGSLQLLSSAAMLPATPELEARVRRVLSQLAAADALPAITGVRDVISVPGNLAGESETQLFVETGADAPVSLSVIRRPGMEPVWGISLGEIVDQSAQPPEPETLAWYRFACELPETLPDAAFLQSDRTARERARADYAFIQQQLGPCERQLP